MKKTFLFLMAWVMLSISSMSAQNYLGTWKADSSFKEQLNTLINEENVDLDLGFVMTKKDINCQLFMKTANDNLSVDLVVSIPGTYSVKGDKFTAKFDTEKSDLKVTNLKSDDPEMNEGLQMDETKDIWYNLVTTMMKKELGDSLKTLSDGVSELFEEFRIKQDVANKLIMLIEDEEEEDGVVEIIFNRAY